MGHTSQFIVGPGLFRLILAIAVVANHITIAQSGLAAVLLFFVLSGYWVSDLWAKTQGPSRVATCYLNRTLRIWPLYLAVMLVCAVVRSRIPGVSEFFLVGLASRPAPHMIGVEWSLDIEVQFYVLFPLLAPLFRRAPPAILVALVLASAFVGWRLEAVTGIVSVLKFMPAFAVGMALHRSRWSPDDRTADLSLMLFVALAVVQVWLWQTGYSAMHAVFGGWDDNALAGMWVAPLLPYLAASLHRRSDAVDRRRGDLSYPLYLAHLPVLLGLQQIYDWRTGPGVLVLFALMGLATAALWLGIDRRAERFRRNVLRVGRPAGRYPTAASL